MDMTKLKNHLETFYKIKYIRIRADEIDNWIQGVVIWRREHKYPDWYVNIPFTGVYYV